MRGCRYQSDTARAGRDRNIASCRYRVLVVKTAAKLVDFIIFDPNFIEVGTFVPGVRKPGF